MSHACIKCNMTLADCDAQLQRSQEPCCDACLTRDSHGLLEHVDASLELRIAEELRALELRVLSLEQTLSTLEQALERVPPTERRALLVEVLSEVREAVRDLPERLEAHQAWLTAIEDVLVRKLGIRKRPPPKPLPPPSGGVP